MAERACKDWTLLDWNKALFLYVFATPDGAQTPVTRIDVTPEILAEVCKERPQEGIPIRQAFLNHFRLTTRQLNKLLNLDSAAKDWNDAEIPPFFAQLVLTLLVASACEETVNEGDFRHRLALELNQPRTTQYRLEYLPKMWECLRDWLDRHRSISGYSLRRLSLPQLPRRDKLIGYSKILAFPSQSDYAKVGRIFAERNLTADSPVLEIITSIRRKRRTLSAALQREFDDFESRYRNLKEAARFHPFWHAIRAVTGDLKLPHADTASPEEVFLRLNFRRGITAEVSLISGDDFRGNSRHLMFLRGHPEGQRMHFLDCSSEQIQMQGSSLCNGPWTEGWSDGCICFTDDEFGEQRSVALVPPVGQFYLAVESRRLSKFQELQKRTEISVSIHSIDAANWKVLGPFDTQQAKVFLEAFRQENDCPKAFSARIFEPRIRIFGSVRVGTSYLLRRGLRVEFDCEKADELEFCLQPRNRPDPFLVRLNRSSENERFVLPLEFFRPDDLPNDLLIRAYYQGKFLADRDIHVVDTVSSLKFGEVTEPGRWLAEGESGDLRPIDGSSENHDAIRELNRRIHTHDIIKNVAGIARPDQCESTFETLPSIYKDLTEILAAIFSNRASLSEFELLNLLRTVFQPHNLRCCWDIIRSLSENWVLDCYQDRRWNSRSYFAHPPAIVECSADCRIIGLIPELKRKELYAFCQERNLVPVVTQGPNLRSIGMIALPKLNAEIIGSLSEVLTIPCRRVDDLVSSTSPLRDIFRAERSASMHASPVSVGQWNWNYGYFAELSGDEEKVTLLEKKYDDMPARYEIYRSSRQIFFTRSRAWAILVGNSLRNCTQFELHSDGTLQRMKNCRSHMPLSIARALTLEGSAAGLFGSPEDLDYRYFSASRRTADRIIGPLRDGQSSAESIALSRWRSALRSFYELRMPTPTTVNIQPRGQSV